MHSALKSFRDLLLCEIDPVSRIVGQMCPQSVYLYKGWYQLLVVLVLASISHNLAKYVLRISLRGLVSSTSTSTSISHDWTKCVLGNYVFTGECVSSGTGAVTGTGIGTGTGH